MKKNPLASTAKKCAKRVTLTAAAAAMCASVNVDFDAVAMRAAMRDMGMTPDSGNVIQMFPDFNGFIA